MPRASTLACLALACFPGLASAERPSPAEFYSACTGPHHPVVSPNKFLKEKGLQINDACPAQSKFDTQRECQVAAESLKDIYRSLLEIRRETCIKARNAAQEAIKNCGGQAACLEAQKKALSEYQAAVDAEIVAIKTLEQTISEVANYAVTEIAAGGAKILGFVEEAYKKPPGGKSSDPGKAGGTGGEFGPQGRSGTAAWLQASTNKEALETVFKNENRRAAIAVVEKFQRSQGSESDITGLRSDIIKEPLRVAAASREWSSQIEDYRRTLEDRKGSMELMKAAVSKASNQIQSNAGAGQPEAGAPTAIAGETSKQDTKAESGTPKGTVSSPSDLTSAGQVADAAGSLAGLAGGPSSQGGDDSSGGEDSDSHRAPSGFGSGLARILQGSAGIRGNPGTISKLGGKDDQAKDSMKGELADKAGSEGGEERNPASGNSGLALSSRKRGQGTRGERRQGVKPAAQGVVGVNGQGSMGNSVNPSEASRAYSETGGLRAEGNGVELGEGVPNGNLDRGNEIAVDNLVATWSKTLYSKKKQREQPPSDEPLGEPAIGDDPSLFLRVNGAHVRAQRKGQIDRNFRNRL